MHTTPTPTMRALTLALPIAAIGTMVALAHVGSAVGTRHVHPSRPVAALGSPAKARGRLRPADPAADQGVATAQPPSIQDDIKSAFAPLGPDAQAWAMRVAGCESRYDPNAVNASSGAEGLFQFLPSTWRTTPFASSSPFDPAANARAAAWLFSTSGPGAWECS